MGDELEYSTYLGGAGFDEGTGIAVDEDGSAYIRYDGVRRLRYRGCI
ncbi:MAG: SBBP repeat-containing protein [Hormoscilla sp. GM7CHS1pb]|nr:SBBP repeat-containing protein [Hormoscilla sp. GM7CHS1pb]